VAFIRVADLTDLDPGRGLCARAGGIEIGVYLVGEEVIAIENACPHAGHPLSEGSVERGIVRCPLHGYEYDLATGFRAEDADGWPIPRFAVRVEGPSVLVDVEQPINLRR
jgi:nitrite reductase/ring-hydroxylating ferredoxin subunit